MAGSVRHRLACVLGVALGVVALSVVSARLVQQSLPQGDRYDLIPGLLALTHVRNTGAAYGMLAGQRWLLVGVSAIVTLVIPLLVLRQQRSVGRWTGATPILAGLLMGGALANLLERLRVGYVTDFLVVPPVPLFRVFNLADVSISIAVLGLALLSLTSGHAPTKGPPRTPS